MNAPLVLVVEDEALILLTLADALEDRGMEVVTATSGEEAVREAERSDGLAALVTDIDLGGPIDGLQLAHRLRAAKPDLGVIYASGRPDLLSAHKPVPGSRLVRKPYRLADVYCELLKVLPGGRPAVAV